MYMVWNKQSITHEYSLSVVWGDGEVCSTKTSTIGINQVSVLVQSNPALV